MINGILGYQDSDPRAAPTGETESTSKPKGYRHPDLRTMIVWDMPGAGTESHPSETYFNDKFLYAFDTLIIVIADRYVVFVTLLLVCLSQILTFYQDVAN